MSGRMWWLILLAFVVFAVGCYAYGGRLIVRGPSTESNAKTIRFDDSDEKVANAIVSQIARENRMQIISEPSETQDIGPYVGLNLYKRGDVALGAMVRSDRSELVFTITDFLHSEPTDFTVRLKEALEAKVCHAFPNSSTKWEQSSKLWVPMAP